MPDFVYRVLRDQLGRERKKARQSGTTIRPEDPVLTSRSRRPYWTSYLLTELRGPMRRLGLPPMRFHDLRHTAASLMLGEGVPPRTVMEIMGHRNLEVTMLIFGHTNLRQQRDAAAALDRAFRRRLTWTAPDVAEFEREMIAEQTRDKMGAARRKGKWVGGMPAFGYDVATAGRNLVINPSEAELVRAMFDLYLQEESPLRVVETIHSRGWRTKAWRTKKGKLHEGNPWGKGSVRHVLTNVTYIGKVDYEGELLAGEHEPIVDEATFAKVGELLTSGRRDPGRTRNDHGFLLGGLVRCKRCGSIMSTSTSNPRGTIYRYYLCGEVNRRGTKACSVRSVPAPELERFVVERLHDMGSDPQLLTDCIEAVIADRAQNQPVLEREQRTLQAAYEAGRSEARRLVAALAQQPEGGDNRSITDRLAELDLRALQIETRLAEIQKALVSMASQPLDRADVKNALSLFSPVWDGLKPREQARVLHLLIDHIDYDGVANEVAITFHPAGITSLADEVKAAAAPPSAEPAKARKRAS